jgi:hypothetical protein
MSLLCSPAHFFILRVFNTWFVTAISYPPIRPTGYSGRTELQGGGISRHLPVPPFALSRRIAPYRRTVATFQTYALWVSPYLEKSFFAKRFNKAKSPSTHASFFARLHPFNCISATSASLRAGNDLAFTTTTCRRVDVYPPNAPDWCWAILPSGLSVWPCSNCDWNNSAGRHGMPLGQFLVMLFNCREQSRSAAALQKPVLSKPALLDLYLICWGQSTAALNSVPQLVETRCA